MRQGRHSVHSLYKRNAESTDEDNETRGRLHRILQIASGQPCIIRVHFPEHPSRQCASGEASLEIPNTLLGEAWSSLK